MKAKKFPWWEDCVDLCREIIRIPSLSGKEGELADYLKGKMMDLGYDEVWVDDPGNVIGKISGNPALPTVGFTAHLDHVSPGSEEEWEYPPYSGTKEGGYIHGRGASDTKGAIATQAYLPRTIEGKDIIHGDIYVFFVVLEEKGGYGSREFNKSDLDLVILGEPTSNQLRIGHRGRVELLVKMEGESAHASVPDKAINPHYDMARFLEKFENLDMTAYEESKSTAAPTIYEIDQSSSNVIPSKATLTIDWRNVPGETPEDITQSIRNILPGNGSVGVNREKLRSYRGHEFVQKRERKPYALSRENPFVSAIEKGLQSYLEKDINVSWWDFATDAGCFSVQDIPVIGFSPCEEQYAHTSEDKVSVELMEEALRCYPVILDSIY